MLHLNIYTFADDGGFTKGVIINFLHGTGNAESRALA
jgi:hypothetical protein